MTSTKPIRHILLIDDDEDDYFFLQEAIRKIDPNINILYWSSVSEDTAYEGESLPDLVFLDINMPGKNGLEVLKCIRSRGYEEVPVVMYSTADNQEYLYKAYKYGANLYFTKQSSMQSLIQSINKLLHLNWHAPKEITSKYIMDGRFIPFAISS